MLISMEDKKGITELLRADTNDGLYHHALDQIEKLNINVNLEETPHQYGNGEGTRIKRVTITVDFPEDVILQGHDSIETDFAVTAITAIAENFYGEAEASLDEALSEGLFDEEQVT